MEKQVEERFRKHKNSIIRKVGKLALYDSQINEICSKLFGSKWNGCHPQDLVLTKPGYQIVNVDSSAKSGSHWVAVVITNKTVYVYDSFGRPTKKLLKILTKQMIDKKMKIHDADYDQEQRGYSEVCGQLCISFLMIASEIGIRKAMLI